MYKKPVSRRKFLLHLSALSPALALLVLKGRTFSGISFAQTATPAATLDSSMLDCVASPSMTEGPYFVDEMLKRIDIRTDPTDNSVRAGVPLKLQIRVLSVSENVCSPLKGAQIDIWHCDATGLYSDESANNTVGKKFLRGYQLTDDNGLVNFTTIYPGWYRGRTVHIHGKVRTFSADGTASYAFNTQFFFDDTLSDQVFAAALYNTRGGRDTTNANDMVYTGSDQGAATPDAHDLGEKMLLTLTKDGDGYATSINIGVDLSKPSAASFSGPGGGGPGGPGGPGAGGPPPGGTPNQ